MKTALITGASRGIGAAVARRLWADGYTVALNYHRSRAEAEALAAELGGVALPADVSDPGQAGGVVEAVLDRLPTAEILSERDGCYEIRAEVFGRGIEMWLRSQGNYIQKI